MQNFRVVATTVSAPPKKQRSANAWALVLKHIRYHCNNFIVQLIELQTPGIYFFNYWYRYSQNVLGLFTSKLNVLERQVMLITRLTCCARVLQWTNSFQLSTSMFLLVNSLSELLIPYNPTQDKKNYLLKIKGSLPFRDTSIVLKSNGFFFPMF